MKYPVYHNHVSRFYLSEITIICCYQDSYVLVANKKEHKFYTPYGSVLENEDTEDAILRILKNTIGTTSCDVAFLDYYQYRRNNVNYFGMLFMINAINLFEYTNPIISDITFHKELPAHRKWLYGDLHLQFFKDFCKFVIVEM